MNNKSHLKPHKFLLACSCLICKVETTAQSLKKHIAGHTNSNIVKTECLYCGVNIYQNGKKFCNRSCSALYNNKLRIRSPESKLKISNIMKCIAAKKPPIPTIRANCVNCGSTFNKKHHSPVRLCSQTCVNANNSKIMKEKIKNGYNPNKHRGRHKRSYMETSFEEWLGVTFPNIKYEIEHPFKSNTLNKTFFTDFFFPDLCLAIELDGTQHNKTIEYDSIRDANILLEHSVYIYRISHKEYKSGVKIPEVINILSMSIPDVMINIHTQISIKQQLP